MQPKIISLGAAFPPRVYSQREVFTALGYPRHFWRIFDPKVSGVETRHMALGLGAARDYTWQQMCDAYLYWAKELTRQVIHNCLDGEDASQIGCVAFASCSGYSCPSIAHHVAGEIGFSRKTYFTPVVGSGCEGGYPALKRAYDFTMATGEMSCAIAVEICTTTYFPEPEGHPDPENDFELARGYCIFGDGAAAALVGYDNNPCHPEILDFETVVDSRYLDCLGYTWRDGRLRLRMSREIRNIAPVLASEAVSGLLSRRELQVGDIAHWVIHSAGADILANIGKVLGLSNDNLALSRETLRLVGNTSSTSIGVSGKRLMEKGQWQPGDYIMVVALGPGMSSGASLLQFPKED